MSTREINQLIKQKRQEGWEVTATKGGHWKFTYKATGDFFFAASTPSDYRAIYKVESDIKRIERKYEMEHAQHRETAEFGLSTENQKKLEEMKNPPQPKGHIVTWKPRQDEDDGVDEKTGVKRKQARGSIDPLYAYKRLTGKNDGEICVELGYSPSAHHGWYEDKSLPMIVYNCLTAMMKVDELQKLLDDATRPQKAPVEHAADPVEFIKQGLAVINNAIKQSKLRAFIKDDGLIGAKVVTEVEL